MDKQKQMVKARGAALRARNKKTTQITNNLHKIIVALVSRPITMDLLDILLSLSAVMVKLCVEESDNGAPTARSRS
jgi:hypothetical protein